MPTNLVSVSQCQLSLATAIDVSDPALPTTVLAASTAISRFCRRIFTLANYSQVVVPQSSDPYGRDAPCVNLKYWPVSAVSRISGGYTTALTILNTDTANQIARVAFTYTGDPAIPASLVYTGLTLTTIASGVQTAQTVSWTVASPFTTVDRVATAINALTNGWSATVVGNLGPWPAAEVVGAISGKSGFPPGAQLGIYADDLSDTASVDYESGILSVRNGAVSAGWNSYGYDSGDSVEGDDDSASAAPVRVQYAAGWTLVPYDVQQACLLTVKAYMQELETNTSFADETADKWKGTLAGLEEREIPDAAKRILFRYQVPI